MHEIFERAMLFKLLNGVCRFLLVMGFVALIGIWGGMEFGELLIGQRLFWSLIDILLMVAVAYGESITGGDQDGLF